MCCQRPPCAISYDDALLTPILIFLHQATGNSEGEFIAWVEALTGSNHWQMRCMVSRPFMHNSLARGREI